MNTKATPESEGGPKQSLLQGGINEMHFGDPAFDTADFADGAPGNLRVDYVLPRKALQTTDAGVFWPTTDDPLDVHRSHVRHSKTTHAPRSGRPMPA